MREQHLSDEAIAAFADDVLAGTARDRARQHTAVCADCNYAVAVQREAIWALRSAPAPSLPIGLLDRLRDVPVSTPINRTPSMIDDNGTAMFATFAAPSPGPIARFVAPMAAFVPPPARPRSRRARPLALTAASMAFVGALSVTVAASGAPNDEPTVAPASVQVPASRR